MPTPASTSKYPAPCRHCTRLLHGEVRFCPYCGGEEVAGLHADIGAVTATSAAATTATASAISAASAADVRPERWTPQPAEAMPPFALEPSFAPGTELQQLAQPGRPSVLSPSMFPREGANAETALLGPAAFEWPEGLPTVITVEPHPPKPRLGALLGKPVAIGTVLSLAVLAVVLGLGPLQASLQAGPGKPQEAAAKLEQAQDTLRRGDLDSAQRELGALSAAYPGHAGVQALQDEFDQREREQAARREQLRDATQKAAQALGLGKPSLSPAPAPASAVPAEAPAAAPAAASAPPAVAAQEPRTAACSEAMAALALCAQEDPLQAPAR